MVNRHDVNNPKDRKVNLAEPINDIRGVHTFKYIEEIKCFVDWQTRNLPSPPFQQIDYI
jgi:hypothetical protein